MVCVNSYRTWFYLLVIIRILVSIYNQTLWTFIDASVGVCVFFLIELCT